MKTPELLKSAAVKWPILYGLAEQFGLKKDYELKCFLKEITKGMVVYDIGANVGRFSKIFSMLTGPTGHVYAFEPIKMNFEILSRLKYPHLQVFNIGLWHEAGQSEIFYPSSDGAQGSLKAQQFGNWENGNAIGKELCQLESLDRFTEKHSLPGAQFVKIDAEGAELNILKGALNFLSRIHPTLFIEVNEKTMESFDYGIKEIWMLLNNIGYNHFTLVGRDYFLALESLTELQNALKKDFSPSILCKK